jgi:hypothetical protein
MLRIYTGRYGFLFLVFPHGSQICEIGAEFESDVAEFCG